MKFTSVLFVLILVASTARFIGLGDHWYFELASHFPVQYGLVTLVLAAHFLRNRNLTLCVASVLLSIVNLSVLAGRGPNPAESPPDSFRVYAANVWNYNPLHGRLFEEIESLQAEIAFLSEITPEMAARFGSKTSRYPFRIGQPASTPDGFLFLSRFPILHFEIVDEEEHGNRPLLVAELLIQGRKVTFYGVHSLNPAAIGSFSQRNQQFAWLARHIAGHANPVIVAGDFNLTPYSPVFRQLLRQADLEDTRAGFGWQPSWPVFLPMLWIPIDHILVGRGVRVHDRVTGSFTGSDHYPIRARLSLEQAQPDP